MTSTPPVVSSDEEVFQWDDISYSVQFKGQEKQILRAVSGAVAGGELCAIIGPSGAGKTSLLNILAGRISSRGAAKRVGGTVKLNGELTGPAALRQRIAYVMQQDLILPTQTVREALHFSAMLRLPTSVVESERRKLVEEMLSDLGLLACADTYVGDEMIRGISGGEKKRLSIGIELVMKPKLIFLDEPTSGLDSFAAHSVVNKMRSIAEHGKCNVLCTIHQPSSEAFHAFHKVLLLRYGQPLFFGPIKTLSTELSRLDRPCPAGYNLADHAVWLIQTEPDEVLDAIQGEMRTPLLTPATAHIVDDGKVDIEMSLASASRPNRKRMSSVEGGRHPGFFKQLYALTVREALSVWRNKPGLIAFLLIPTCLNLIYANIFYRVGDVNRDDYDMFSHFGGFTMVAISGMFGAAQPLLLRFPLDRGIFLREYATGSYSAAAYFLSKMMVEMPQLFANALIVFLVSYWLMAFQGPFIVFVAVFWVSGLAASSLALFVGSVAANPEVANQMAPALFVPQLLFVGFYIRMSQVPVWINWAQYLCSLKYAMNLMILNEFGAGTRADWSPQQQEGAKSIIDDNDINPGQWWLYVLILLAGISFFRLLAIIALARRAARFSF